MTVLSREERVRLDELCMVHAATGETSEERYGRLALGLADAVKFAAPVGRRVKWTDARLRLLLAMVDRQAALNRLRPVTLDGVEGWHLTEPQPDKVAVGHLKEQYPEIFGAVSDKTLANKVGKARALASRK